MSELTETIKSNMPSIDAALPRLAGSLAQSTAALKIRGCATVAFSGETQKELLCAAVSRGVVNMQVSASALIVRTKTDYSECYVIARCISA